MEYAAIAMTATASVFAALWAFVDFLNPRRSRIRRRVAGEFQRAAVSPDHPLYRNVELLESDSETELHRKPVDAPSSIRRTRTTLRRRLETLLRLAGLPFTPVQFAWATGLTAAAIALIAYFALGWPGIAIGGPIGLAFPLMVVIGLKSRRQQRYSAQLAGAFEMMSRVIRSGQTVPEAFRAATASFGEPLRNEFSLCVHQIEHGIRPEAAYREMCDRAGILELRIFVMAMTIQRQTGGNLSEMLDRVASLIRTRIRCRQKIRAFTAEGRMQSTTLIVLPFLTFAVMYVLNRPYAAALLDHPNLLLAMGACMGIGIIWIRKIMSFEG